MSRQLKEAARMRTSTWRGPGLGVGRSATRNPSKPVVATISMHFIAALPSTLMVELLAGAAHAVGEAQRILMHRVGAPGDMAVRPHEHQLALVSFGDRRIGNGGDADRHLPLAEGALDRRAVWRVGAEAQQREAAAE